MIENFTEEELKQIITELKEYGIGIERANGVLIKEEADKVFGCDAFISTEMRKAICLLADYLSNNRTQKGKNIVTNRFVPSAKEDEYRKIINTIFEAIKPYFGMEGFCSKKQIWGRLNKGVD